MKGRSCINALIGGHRKEEKREAVFLQRNKKRERDAFPIRCNEKLKSKTIFIYTYIKGNPPPHGPYATTGKRHLNHPAPN